MGHSSPGLPLSHASVPAVTPAPTNHTGDRLSAAMLCAAATLVLGLGASVYVLDRPDGSAYGMPSGWVAYVPGRSFFGPVGDWLPSFAHAFAFTVFTAAMLPAARATPWVAAALWGAIGSVLEIGQHPALSATWAAALPAWLADVPVLDHLAAYWRHGGFDGADLAAGAVGCVSAVMCVLFVRSRGFHRVEANHVEGI
jgi:hypothetical protein